MLLLLSEDIFAGFLLRLKGSSLGFKLCFANLSLRRFLLLLRLLDGECKLVAGCAESDARLFAL